MPWGHTWPSCLPPSQTWGSCVIVRHCIWKARLGGARWLAAGEQLWGCRGGGDPRDPGAGLLPGRQGTDLGLTKPGGEGRCPNLTARWLSLKVVSPPGPAPSNILKPLVKGESVSHVPRAGGIKSSRRTLGIRQ